MINEDEVRVLFEDTEVPPIGIEVAELVRRGDKRIRRRRLAEVTGGIALAAALVAVVAVPLTWRSQVTEHPAGAAPAKAAASPAATVASPSAATAATKVCAASALAVPAGLKDVGATVVDPSGRYIGGASTAGENFVPVLWTDGKPERLPVVDKSVEIDAINVNGVVVGLDYAGGKTQDYVYRYDHGTTTRLTLPPGSWHPFPTPAINAAGDIVINIEPSGHTGGDGSFAVIWRAGHNTATKIPLPKGANVFGINDDETLVGGVYKNGIGVSAWAWDLKGHGRKLTAPAGYVGLAYSVSGDWATGGLWDKADGGSIAPLWNIKTGALTKITSDKPNANLGGPVNSSGWIVDAAQRVHMDGALATLGSLETGDNVTASGMSDHGLVVGASEADGRKAVPVQWQC